MDLLLQWCFSRLSSAGVSRGTMGISLNGVPTLGPLLHSSLALLCACCMPLRPWWSVSRTSTSSASASSTTERSTSDGHASPARRWKLPKGATMQATGQTRDTPWCSFGSPVFSTCFGFPYIFYFLLESSHVLDSPALSFVTTWLAISNSFCNCVIYSLSNSVFRLGMRRLSQTLCSFSPCSHDDKDFGESKPRKRAKSCSI